MTCLKADIKNNKTGEQITVEFPIDENDFDEKLQEIGDHDECEILRFYVEGAWWENVDYISVLNGYTVDEISSINSIAKVIEDFNNIHNIPYDLYSFADDYHINEEAYDCFDVCHRNDEFLDIWISSKKSFVDILNALTPCLCANTNGYTDFYWLNSNTGEIHPLGDPDTFFETHDAQAMFNEACLW